MVMKGINVCCDGEKTLEKDLAKLSFENKKKSKKRKHNLLSILMFFSSVSESKLDLQRR